MTLLPPHVKVLHIPSFLSKYHLKMAALHNPTSGSFSHCPRFGSSTLVWIGTQLELQSCSVKKLFPFPAQPPYKNNEFYVTSDLLEALQYQPALARLKGKELKDGYTIVFSGDGVNRAAYTLWEEVESGWQNIKFSLDAFELDIDNPN